MFRKTLSLAYLNLWRLFNWKGGCNVSAGKVLHSRWNPITYQAFPHLKAITPMMSKYKLIFLNNDPCNIMYHPMWTFHSFGKEFIKSKYMSACSIFTTKKFKNKKFWLIMHSAVFTQRNVLWLFDSLKLQVHFNTFAKYLQMTDAFIYVHYRRTIFTLNLVSFINHIEKHG